MRLPTKTLEKKLFSQGYKKIIAVDEVGMGSLAGPVVVCAVQLNKNFFQKRHKNLHWLRDSKLLSPHQRGKFVKELLKISKFHASGFKFQIGYCFPKIIDRINIYQAARLAMKRAINKITNSKKLQRFRNEPQAARRNLRRTIANSWQKRVIVLVDGKNKIKGLQLEQMPIIKGDRKVFSIACASLIAKVFRDKMMARYAKKFPEYEFEKHKGYGTKFHRVMLVKLGRSPIHRDSFRFKI